MAMAEVMVSQMLLWLKPATMPSTSPKITPNTIAIRPMRMVMGKRLASRLEIGRFC